MWHRTRRLAVWLAAVWSMSASFTWGVEANAVASLASGYNSRGMLLTDQPVFQPQVSVTASNGLFFSAWGNMDLTDRMSTASDKEFSEVDLTIAYQRTWRQVQGEIGYIEYLYPHQTTVQDDGRGTPRYYATDGTREVYGKAGTPLGPFQVTVALYYDFDEVNGFYSTLTLAKEFQLTERLKLTGNGQCAFADANYNKFNFSVPRGAFNDGSVCAGLEWKLADSLSVSGCVQYMVLLDARIREAGSEKYFSDKAGTFIEAINLTYNF